MTPNRPLPDEPEAREDYDERLRATPIKLRRLRSFGDENRWRVAFYAYSNDRSRLAMFPTRDFFGPPEGAFEVAA